MVLEADHLSSKIGLLWPIMCIIDPIPSNKDNDIIIFGGTNPFKEEPEGKNEVTQILHQN